MTFLLLIAVRLLRLRNTLSIGYDQVMYLDRGYKVLLFSLKQLCTIRKQNLIIWPVIKDINSEFKVLYSFLSSLT